MGSSSHLNLPIILVIKWEFITNPGLTGVELKVRRR